MLKLADKNDFDNVFAIMCESFPKDEYRTRDEQKELFERDEYRVYLDLSSTDGTIRGFAAVWVLDNVCFLEHLAVDARFRNQGIGAKIIGELLELFDRRVCLEVELPEKALAKRRIGFYERCGFTLNGYSYLQPAMSAGQNAVPLLVMTSWGALEPTAFSALRDLLYDRVYGVSHIH